MNSCRVQKSTRFMLALLTPHMWNAKSFLTLKQLKNQQNPQNVVKSPSSPPFANAEEKSFPFKVSIHLLGLCAHARHRPPLRSTAQRKPEMQLLVRQLKISMSGHAIIFQHMRSYQGPLRPQSSQVS